MINFVLSCLFLFLFLYLPSLIAFVRSTRDTVLSIMVLNTIWVYTAFFLTTPSAPVFTIFDLMAFVLYVASFFIMVGSVPHEKGPKNIDIPNQN